MRLFFVISLFFTLSVFQNLKAQTIPMGGGDCQTAALVCNTSVTIEDTIYFGHSAGAQQVGAGSATPGCWSKGEIWPFWYTFTVATSGSFEFILTPFNGSIRNDWDWMLFDVTGGCGTISNANLVACNFSNDCNTSTGISSINRASWTGTCNIFNNPWENTINLTAGRTYSLIVDAFEFPGANFRIRFNQNNLPDAVTFLDINADFTANPNPVCSGSSISFTNNSTGQPGMPLSYQWNFGDGNTSTSANPTHTYAAPGTYTVTLRAFNTSCQDIHTLNVTVAQPIAITSTINYVSCNGGSNGGVNINSVTGGIPPYSYLWSNGATSQNLGGVTAGSYSLTITDAINCTNTFNFTITEPPPISITSSVTNVSCNAGSNGAISINPVTGGTPPYSYLWSNGSTSQNISGLTAGSYNVTITDANTCTRNFSFTITEPLPITATANITNVTCNNGNNGSINLTSVSGGLAPYSYLWSNGATTQNINSLTAGSYTVTITDANNCSSANTFNVTQPAPISASSSITNVSCNGGNNGAIDITPSGGTAPYTFLWAGGQTSEDILGLTAGTYSVTITDANLCQRNFSFNVTEPAVISTTSTVNNASCNGSNNGSINLNTVSGGTAPYTFAWSNGANTQNISGLAPGPYSVTITDANLCTGTFNFNITEPALIAVTESLTHVTCNNGSNGAIILTSVTGGTAPYTFTWSNGATTQNISNVTANNYTVTVRDNNNCQQDFSFTINQPTAITTTASITDASCNGGNNGAIDITSVSGGTAPYSYAWSNGATTDDISGVTAGAYTLTVTDANNCTATFNYNVGQPVAINAVANITNVSCNGGNNGAIDITPSGGTAPYTFLWAGGQTSEDISGLTAGTYSVTITDANLCQRNFSFNVTEPAVISTTSTVNNASCNGSNNGSINLNTVSGGTAPYTFAWSNGANTQNISGLAPGPYSVTITDANLCTGTFNFNITEPALIAVTESLTHVTCNNGSNGAITLTSVTGGTAPYTFTWSNGATTQNISNLTANNYTVTVRDNNNCQQDFNFTINQPAAITTTASITDASCNGGNNGAIDITSVNGGTAPYSYAWSNGANTDDISGLNAGAYTLTVTDGNNCTATFNYNVGQPVAINAVANITNVSCNGGNNGAIDITPSGGTAPYTFLWAGGQTSEDISGLTAGTYSVTITDANLCQRNFSFNVTEPAVISTTSTVNNASCNGSNNGSINLNTVSGGTAPYTFAWSNGANTQNISGLAPGLYSVTITDANLCTGTFNFNITEPSLIAVTESLTHVTCNNGSNGAITLTSVTGGTAPYTFTWSNGATTQNISNVTANNYTVTVRDNNNCQQDFSFTINQPDAITTTASITDASCNGGNNGAIDITSVNGGTAPYSYDWSNGATTDDISGLTAGAYTLTVTDANNCTQNFVYNVDEPAALNPDATLSHVSCPGGNNGAITINSVSGGTAPHTFEWFDNSTANSVSGLTAGSYSVTITDAFNCFTVASFTINQPAPISVVADTDSSTCNGADNGAITLTQLNGGTAPYTFAWSNAETTQDISNLAPGAYSVTVSDANLCTASFNFDIFEPALIAVTEDLTQVTCNGGTDGAITLTSVTGGTAPFTFTWSNGATTQNISNVTANNYTVTVRDNNNCQQDFSFTINQPAAITTTASITDASCNGGNNGAIDITSVNGGTAPYSYAWSNGATTDDISGVTAGAYTLTVTDANNCTQDFIYNVGEPATLTPDATLSHVSCPGGNNGAITINSVSGGTAPHTFEWFDNSTGSSVNGLTAGSYSVTITDAFNCFTVASFTINQPAPISVVADTDSSTCNGADNGAITLTQVNGGTAPYTFAWSNAETTQDISNLAPGAYSVTVSDANLCTASFNFDIFEPAIIAVTEDLTHVTCNGGTDGAITLTSVTGGTAPYTFTWSNGATTQNISNVTANNYTVTVRDINNCQQDFSFIINQPDAVASNEVISNVSCMGTANGSISLNISGGTAPYSNFNWTNGETTQDISGLDAGSYGVTFEDASGCNYTFNFNVTEPGPLTGTASANPSNICPGNPVDITASFNATFTPGLNGYSFDGGITFQGGSVYNIPSVSSDTTVNVVLEDINGCRSSVIAVNISMKVFDAVINSTPVSCNGGNDGEAEISNISGGNAPYMYSFNGSPFGNSGTFTNLAAGTYTINVMDAQNCPSSYTVTVTQPDILVVSIDTLINVNPCAGANNGQVRLNATGGNVGYNYQMLSPAITNTTGIFTNLVPGTYNFEVTDSRGCFGTANATIIEPSPVDVQSINATIRRVTCAGYNNGRISLSNITGGVSPYTFNLNGRIKSVPVFDTLTAGNYNLTITDANGCPFTYSFNIPSPPPMVLNLQEVKGETCNNKDGEIILAGASGGTPSNFGYSFNINGGPFIPNQLVFSNLGSGTYTLGVIDSLQCYAGYTVVLSKKPGPIPYIRIERPLCRDEENGSIIVDSLQGGIPPFSFILNGNHMGNNTTFSGLGAGSYTMSVQDSTCIFAVTTYYLYNGVNYDTILTPPIIVTNPTDIDAQLIGVNSSGLSGSGMIWVYAVTGGAGKYEIGIDGVNYKPYNPADTTGNFLGNLTHGEYTVYIKDTNGCEITKTITINLNFFIPNLFTPNNDDSNDYFKILGLPSRSQLRVFNRWGSRVYENENYDNSWDGSGLPDGVYYYDLELPSGKVYKGWVEIMR